jgi:hypothetical protein
MRPYFEMDIGHFPNTQFPRLDRWISVIMEIEFAGLRPGRTAVIESPSRLEKEQKRRGHLHALSWVWLADGRSAVSVPPGTGSDIRNLVEGVRSPEQFGDPELTNQLKTPIDAVLAAHGFDATDLSSRATRFACNAALLHRHHCGDCRQIFDDSIPAAEGISMPTHCFPDGIVYAVVADGVAASIAYAHPTSRMADRAVDLGIETGADYRRRGYAKTSVSAVVHHMTRVGGEAWYGTTPDNSASIATARSVGFVPYLDGFSLTASNPDAGSQPPTPDGD